MCVDVLTHWAYTMTVVARRPLDTPCQRNSNYNYVISCVYWVNNSRHIYSYFKRHYFYTMFEGLHGFRNLL